MSNKITLNRDVVLMAEGKIATTLIEGNWVILDGNHAKSDVHTVLYDLCGREDTCVYVKDGREISLERAVDLVVSEIPLHLVYMGNRSGYYVLLPCAIIERDFVKRDLSMRLEYFTRIAWKMLAFWDGVWRDDVWSKKLGQIFTNNEVESKLALLLYQLFSSAEAYEKDPREWYHGMLLKSYPQIADEEIKLRNMRKYRVGKIWIVERYDERNNVYVYSRERPAPQLPPQPSSSEKKKRWWFRR